MLKKIISFASKHRLFLGIFAYCLFCWVWLLEIDLGELASSSFAGKLMLLLTVLALTLLSALLYAVSLRLLLARLDLTKKWLIPIKLMAWWAATEMFVAWAVSIIWYGTGARFDNILPFTSLSHFAIWTPFGFLSRFVGIYGLSGVVFMLGTVAVLPRLRKLFLPTLTVVVLVTFVAWVVYRKPHGNSVPVTAVSYLRAHDVFTRSASENEGRLFIFPEYGFSDTDNQKTSEILEKRKLDKKVYFVGSRFVYKQDRVKNQLVAGDTKSGYTYQIDKSRLIPMGEYVPYLTVGLFKAIGAQYVLDYFKNNRQIAKADGVPQEMLLQLGESRVGAGVCSSIIAPEDYRLLTKHGANVLTNSADLSIFSGSQIYDWHQRSMAKLMATANARAFIQAATSGPSFSYDKDGRLLFNKVDKGASDVSIQLNSRRTPYSIIGEYISIGGIAWILLSSIKIKKKR